jgi:monoamine oxidase
MAIRHAAVGLEQMDSGMPGSHCLIAYEAERSEITRRRLLASGLAGAGLVTIGAAEAADCAHKVPAQVDVIIVGAGFAGLSAALQVARAGHSVLVLEARDRVGGRVVNRSIGNGQVLEAGGQWIGVTQNRMARLARIFGVETYPTFEVGSGVTIFGGERRLGGFRLEVEAKYKGLINALQTLADDVPIDTPWAAPQAATLDAMTLEQWIDGQTDSSDARAAFESVADLWGAETRDVSLLFALFYIAAAGNEHNPGTLARLLGTRQGAQQLRFVGGSQLIAQKMAASLGNHVILSAPVRSISQTNNGVLARTDQYSVEAQRIIVAIPPPLALGIQYEPALPDRRVRLLQGMPMGALVKVQAIYDRPFWRDMGLSGISRLEGEPVSFTFDNSPPSGSPGVLVGFIGGDEGRAWGSYPADKRRSMVLAAFASIVGNEALSPLDFIDKDWPEEPWSVGCPVAYAPPGILTAFGDVIRTPVGPIHWAGTETATFWNGYMEGAVRSGERAAAEVLAVLAA